MEQIDNRTYWRHKEGSTFIVRTGEDTGLVVSRQANGTVTRKHTHYGSKDLLDQRLSSFIEIEKEEFEQLIIGDKKLKES
jgi:hypothetical protein